MTSAAPFVSSSSRPLGVRVRPDLRFVPQIWQGREYFVARDPVSLRFYRFEAEEYALLQMLDGRRSADQVREEFCARFAPQKITAAELFQFIGSLHRSCLLVSESPGQSHRLRERELRNRHRARKAVLSNVLAVRLRGFDPDGLLTVLNRWLGWMFSWPVVVACLALMFAALTLVVVNFETFLAKIPSIETFFGGSNWFWLALVLSATKVLHELGHGLACKRMGSQCHNMGVMFLVLMPCLYCDVSDSWMLPGKWKRAAIAAAGMYIEFVLAALAVFVWWFSDPGIVNTLALNIVVVCSLSTILFNANPLMRYDGYYILCDLLEVPNLRQKSTAVLSRAASRWALGIESPQDPFMPVRHRWLFGLYSFAAVAWRWIITISIFWFLYQLLEPYGLKLIGQLIAVLAIYGLVASPLMQLFRFLKTPGRINAMKPLNTGVTMAVSLAALAAVLAIPLPHHVRCGFVTQPSDAAAVYIEVPGRLHAIGVQPGEFVRAGQPLVQLVNAELDTEIASLEGEYALADVRLRVRRWQASIDPASATEIDSAQAELEAVSRRLEQKRLDAGRMTVCAPCDGFVLAPDYVRKSHDEQSGRLAGWFGYPLEPRNRGAWMETGTVLCVIAPENAAGEAILAIDQADIEFVAAGDAVELFPRQAPGVAVASQIGAISPVEMKQAPRGLDSRHGGSLVTSRDEQGRDVPVSTTFQVQAVFPQEALSISAGATGYARIRTGNQTVGLRLWRAACRTFRFDL